MKLMLTTIGCIVLLTGCGGNNANVSTPTPSPTQSITTEITVNGVTLTSIEDSCADLPSEIKEDELFNRVVQAKLGSTVDEVVTAAGLKPTEGPIVDQSTTTLLWIQDTGPYRMELRAFFDKERLSDKSVDIGENVGQPNEKVCVWKVK